MEQDSVLKQAKHLYDLGMAIHWLHPKSKRPIDSGWTTGPRKSWEELRRAYRKGMNVGVRLGKPSVIEKNFLGAIDVDVKSKEERHAKEVEEKLNQLFGDSPIVPAVNSGRGNGSRHLYILTPKPLKPRIAFRSPDIVKVSMPGSAAARPSKREKEALTAKEIEAGVRLRPAWEIGVMGQGQQVVLPPSIHPDSGKTYKWLREFKPQLALDFDAEKLPKPDEKPAPAASAAPKVKSEKQPLRHEPFEVVPVEVEWLPDLDDKIRKMIVTGEGVEDRSAMLLPIGTALLNAGLTRNEILSVLTNPNYFIGETAYHHAKTKDRERAAAWVAKYTLTKVYAQSVVQVFEDTPIEEPVALSSDEAAAERANFKAADDWRLHLDVTKDDKIRGTLFNTVSILENAVGKSFIKRDLFSYRDFYAQATPWKGEVDKALTDDDVVKIKLWIAENFGCEPSANIIGEALTIVATNNAFDPLKDWLRALPEWDGVERLDGWLKNHFGAKGDEEYLAQVFRKWLVAMVMRIERPGAKFDWMPIFEGAQGVGKSSFGRLLCGDKYFLDWLPDLANKDSALALQGIWSVEMGELASFRKNEIETVKAFITRTVDKVRPPYGERWIEAHRRCVFFGTTNFETYLRDDSGNRRFKPVKVGRLDFATLEEERTQLFAEALWLYRKGFETERTLDISGSAKVYEATIQNEKMIADESALMFEVLQDFIQAEMAKPEDGRFPFSKFKLSDLFKGDRGAGGPITLPLGGWKFDSRNVQFAAKALKNLGAANFTYQGHKYWKLTV